MSKSLTASLKKLLKISAHVSGLLIISLPSERIILLFLGDLSEKKMLHMLAKFPLVRNKIMVQMFIKVLLNLPQERCTVISLPLINVSRFCCF